MASIKILNVAGARPNFMKVAPIIREIEHRSNVSQELIHTGQHYDHAMSQVFFDELGIPEPNQNLEVGPAERIQQIEMIMARFEPVMTSSRPDAVLVVGDVNSTAACARVAKNHGIPVIHVEAGLRSFDDAMPEELNRVETDQLSDLLFVTEPSGMANISNESLPGKAFLVGNVMIDSLVHQLPHIRKLKVHERFGVAAGEYVACTFHRPSNVDAPETLVGLIEIIRFVCRTHPVVFPMHPRTRNSLERHGLLEELSGIEGLTIIDPLGYREFNSLILNAYAVVTDSGGIQEETTYLGVPCVTMRENTERPVTVEQGSNYLAGTTPARVKTFLEKVLVEGERKGARPDLWDGATAPRILDIVERELGDR